LCYVFIDHCSIGELVKFVEQEGRQVKICILNNDFVIWGTAGSTLLPASWLEQIYSHRQNRSLIETFWTNSIRLSGKVKLSFVWERLAAAII